MLVIFVADALVLPDYDFGIQVENVKRKNTRFDNRSPLWIVPAPHRAYVKRKWRE